MVIWGAATSEEAVVILRGHTVVNTEDLIGTHVEYQAALHILCLQSKLSVGCVVMLLHAFHSRVPEAPVLAGFSHGQRSLGRGLFLLQWHVSPPSAPPGLR